MENKDEEQPNYEEIIPNRPVRQFTKNIDLTIQPYAYAHRAVGMTDEEAERMAEKVAKFCNKTFERIDESKNKGEEGFYLDPAELAVELTDKECTLLLLRKIHETVYQAYENRNPLLRIFRQMKELNDIHEEEEGALNINELLNDLAD